MALQKRLFSPEMIGRTVYHYKVLDKIGGAATEYQRFLELWRDADPKRPELAQARAYLKAH